ncbi:LysR family transcriptional regulator [Klebsiella spallanzanii]|uniref:LysR family transcriptional regulator n=1 Tax=Klebsiella spallanzanii TaxID=2587528 RepID=UPI001118EF49|nr:LysR family transcriptional regulator [Klebsiella spallanzanii]
MSHLTHLRTFLEAYRTGSFSRAAEQLGITQPAASQHIQALESLVGKPLFVRQARGVKATDAAEELARAVAPFIDGVEAKIASYRPQVDAGGTVYFVGSSDFVYYRFTPTLAKLMNAGYRVRFHVGDRARIYTMLEDDSVDFAITASVPDEKNYHYCLLHTERMLLVHSPALTDAIGMTPDMITLSQLPLIAFDEDLPLIRTLWQAMFHSAPPLQAALTIPDMRIIRQMVIDGQGWSVLPDYHCADALAQGRLVSPTPVEISPTSYLYLVWHKKRENPRLNRIREIITADFAS